MAVAEVLGAVLGPDTPVAVKAYDGSRYGPEGAATTVVITSPAALRRLLRHPGELGFTEAYIAGDVEVEGDLFTALAVGHRLGREGVRRPGLTDGLRLAREALRASQPALGERASVSGRRHSPARDAAAISHHYDLPGAFFRLLLGPSMTYSCGVWCDPAIGLEAAQEAKHELVGQKLGLEPGMRLLDVGCGWGTLALHAARRFGVIVVGVTLSRRQAEWAERAVQAAGMTDRVKILCRDYREVDDGPYQAISSIGMSEHVGRSQLSEYFERLRALLTPGGRLVNQAIARPTPRPSRLARKGFMDRYVFPDAEVHEVGFVVSTMQRTGFEVHHLESLRHHYALTLRAWVANLDRSWEETVALVGPVRARIFRLYMTGLALNFEANGAQVHQVLATTGRHPGSPFPLRPRWDLTTVSG